MVTRVIHQAKIDYSRSLLFEDFILERRPEKNEFSDIDMTEVKNSQGRKITLV
jgi:hypothetical protein